MHVLTHTLHYGLGVFEGVRCYEGAGGRSAIFRLREHTERLFASAHILGIEIPFTPRSDRRRLHRDGAQQPAESCYIRPLVFLGDGEMGLAAVQNPVRVAVIAWPWGSYLGDAGRAQRHPGQDLVVSALSRQYADEQGQGGRPLRQLDPGRRRGAPRRLRRSADARRRRLRRRVQRREHLHRQARTGEDLAADLGAARNHARYGDDPARRARHRHAAKSASRATRSTSPTRPF